MSTRISACLVEIFRGTFARKKTLTTFIFRLWTNSFHIFSKNLTAAWSRPKPLCLEEPFGKKFYFLKKMHPIFSFWFSKMLLSFRQIFSSGWSKLNCTCPQAQLEETSIFSRNITFYFFASSTKNFLDFWRKKNSHGCQNGLLRVQRKFLRKIPFWWINFPVNDLTLWGKLFRNRGKKTFGNVVKTTTYRPEYLSE